MRPQDCSLEPFPPTVFPGKVERSVIPYPPEVLTKPPPGHFPAPPPAAILLYWS